MAGRIDRGTARDILSRCRAPVGGNFHALNSDAVEALLGEARTYAYRHPRNANGSRARYWHDYLQRAAQRERD